MSMQWTIYFTTVTLRNVESKAWNLPPTTCFLFSFLYTSLSVFYFLAIDTTLILVKPCNREIFRTIFVYLCHAKHTLFVPKAELSVLAFFMVKLAKAMHTTCKFACRSSSFFLFSPGALAAGIMPKASGLIIYASSTNLVTYHIKGENIQ